MRIRKKNVMNPQTSIVFKFIENVSKIGKKIFRYRKKKSPVLETPCFDLSELEFAAATTQPRRYVLSVSVLGKRGYSVSN